MQKIHVSLSFMAVLVCSVIPASLADVQIIPGKNFFGANRRVTTEPNGYVGVKGTFKTPEIKVPLVWKYNPDLFALTPYGPLESYADSKPSFYFGSTRGPDPNNEFELENIEVDAGVQWEWKTQIFTVADPQDPSKRISDYRPPGWTIFINNRGMNDKNWSAFGWRSSPGRTEPDSNPGVTEFQLTYVLERHFLPVGFTAYLDVKAVGANTQPGYANGDGSGRIWASDGQPICMTLEGTSVKRVVAITQGGSNLRFGIGDRPDNDTTPVYEEDGSWMKGSVFSNGQIATRNGVTLSWHPWSQIPIDAARTGWYPDKKDKSTYILRPYFSTGHAADAKWVFDFPSLGNQNLPGRYASYPNRYDEETIDISLRYHVPTSILGGGVKPGS